MHAEMLYTHECPKQGEHHDVLHTLYVEEEKGIRYYHSAPDKTSNDKNPYVIKKKKKKREKKRKISTPLTITHLLRMHLPQSLCIT